MFLLHILWTRSRLLYRSLTEIQRIGFQIQNDHWSKARTWGQTEVSPDFVLYSWTIYYVSFIFVLQLRLINVHDFALEWKRWNCPFYQCSKWDTQCWTWRIFHTRARSVRCRSWSLCRVLSSSAWNICHCKHLKASCIGYSTMMFKFQWSWHFFWLDVLEAVPHSPVIFPMISGSILDFQNL